MDTTSSNNGKGAMNAISGTQADNKGFRMFDEKSLNKAPATTMPYNQYIMVPPNPSVHGEALAIAPLTVAMPGESVAPTPSCIRNHPAYKGGWKVLLHPRHNGRVVDKTYNHEDFGRFRSMKAVISVLDYLWNSQKNEESSADQDNQVSGVNQSAEGNGAGASQSAEGKHAEAINESTEGKSAAGASHSAKGKSVA